MELLLIILSLANVWFIILLFIINRDWYKHVRDLNEDWYKFMCELNEYWSNVIRKENEE